MEKLFFLAIVSGAILLPTFSYGQQKYIYKPSAASSLVQKKVYLSKNQVNSAIPARVVNDPPIINDPIDIYAGNPVLLKASMTIHFGDINAPSTNSPLIRLLGSPDYFYHNADHILINTVTSNSISSNMAYTIPLFSNSDNHWTVTYDDFVTKYVDSAHSHLDYNYWKRFKGGGIGLKLPGNGSFQVNKMILVLKFSNGTKTIVWDTPIKSTSITNTFTTFSNLDFKFNQDFEPMN